jgi:hypothetical protein
MNPLTPIIEPSHVLDTIRNIVVDATQTQKLHLFDLWLRASEHKEVRIAIDMDDTLVDFLPTCETVMRHINPNVGPFVSRKSHELLGITLDQWFDHMNKIRMLDNLPAKGGAVAALRALQTHPNLKVHVEVVTSRGFYKDAHRITSEWLLAHGIRANAVHVVPFGVSKAKYMLEHCGIFDFFADDVYDECVEVVDTGIARRSLLINMPWNYDVRCQSDVHRIDCFGEFVLAHHLEVLCN